MIDWTRVEELISEIGEEDFGEVVEIFLEEVDTAVASLSSDSEVEESLQTLHLIKGCAWNLGFAELGKLCAGAEGHGETLSPDTYTKLRDSYAASRAAFIDGLAARSAASPAA